MNSEKCVHLEIGDDMGAIVEYCTKHNRYFACKCEDYVTVDQLIAENESKFTRQELEEFLSDATDRIQELEAENTELNKKVEFLDEWVRFKNIADVVEELYKTDNATKSLGRMYQDLKELYDDAQKQLEEQKKLLCDVKCKRMVDNE